MVEHVNRAAVDSRHQRLVDEYGVGYHEDETVSVDPGEFEAELDLARDGYLGSSYVWIVRTPDQGRPLSESMPADGHEDSDRVLMILGRGGHAWGIPGGGRETGETFEESARREVREETAIECAITDCFGTRHERRQSPEHDQVLHTLRVVFEGVYDGGSIAIQPGELNGAAWVACRPRSVHPLAAPLADEWFED